MVGDGQEYSFTSGQPEHTSLSEELQALQQMPRTWRTDFSSLKPPVARSGQGDAGEQAGNNTNGGQQESQPGPKPWRATYGEVAPGFWHPTWNSGTPNDRSNAAGDRGTGGSNSNQGGSGTPGGDGWHFSPNQPAMQLPNKDISGHPAQGSTSDLGKLAAEKQKAMDDLGVLSFHPGLVGSEALSGISGIVVGRGVVNKLLSKSARWYLLNTDTTDQFTRPARWLNRNLGLNSKGEFMGEIGSKESEPESKLEAKLASDIQQVAQNLENNVQAIKDRLPSLLPENDRKALVHYRELLGHKLPSWAEHSELTTEEAGWINKWQANSTEIEKLILYVPDPGAVRLAWDQTIDKQTKAREALNSRLAGGSNTADKAWVDTEKYLQAVLKNPKEPLPPGLKLEDIDECNVRKWRELHQQVEELRPGNEAVLKLEDLYQKNEEIQKYLKSRAEALNIDVKALESQLDITNKSIKLPEVDKKIYQQYEFLNGGGLGEIPQNVLTPEQEKLVQERRALYNKRISIGHAMQERLGLLPYAQSVKQYEELTGRIKGLASADSLKAGSIKAILDAGYEKSKLTDEQKAILAVYDWLKEGALGKTPPEATIKIGTEAKYLVGPEVRHLIGRHSIYDPALTINKLESERKSLPMQFTEAAKKLDDRIIELEYRDRINALTGQQGQELAGIRFFKEQARGLDLQRRATTLGETLSEAEKEELALFNKEGVKKTFSDIEALAGHEEELHAAELLGKKQALEERLASFVGETELKASHGWKMAANDFGKGWLIGEGVNLTDDILDRTFHLGPVALHQDNYFKSLIVPAAVLTPGKFLSRAVVSSGTLLLGSLFDSILPSDKNPQFYRLMRPNTLDSTLVTAALMMPLKEESTALRIGMVGSAWAISRLSNFFGAKSAEEVKKDAVTIWKADEQKRSFDSMKSAIDEMKTLSTYGREGDSQVYLWFSSWVSKKHADPITGARGNAILATSIGETVLKNGMFMGYHNGNTQSFLNAVFKGHNPKEQDYILSGENIDLGGRSLKYLRRASQSIDNAKVATQARLGNDDNGKTITQSEIDGLNRIGNRIADDRALILGKHNIPQIFNILEDYTRKLGQTPMTSIYMKLQGDIKTGSKDRQFMAKLYRDLALIDLAWVATDVHAPMPNGGGAAQLYAEAQQALAEASKDDGGNEDLPQLNAIAQELGSSIPAAQNTQWQKLNILGVDRQ